MRCRRRRPAVWASSEARFGSRSFTHALGPKLPGVANARTLTLRMPSLPFVVESQSPAEQHVSFRVGDSWCRANDFTLKSGARLSVTALEFEPGFAFATVQPAAEVELVISKGSTLCVRSLDGQTLDRGGNTLQAGRAERALPLQVSAPAGTRMECVSVSLSRAHLRELLGSATLPQALLGARGNTLSSHAMTPQLFRLLEELTHADARGRSRLLWHEAKSQELIALVTDELAESASASALRVSAHELERLERVRHRLRQRLDLTPSLTELAKLAGFNETKLKGAFRAAFGTSIFAYLRLARLEEARRLLLQRGLNVTEVAQRVGYANPSKFAAAFRRHFQLSPSDL